MIVAVVFSIAQVPSGGCPGDSRSTASTCQPLLANSPAVFAAIARLADAALSVHDRDRVVEHPVSTLS